MSCLKLDYSKIYKFLPESFIENNEEIVKVALDKLINKTAPGYDYTGWVDYTPKLATHELEDIINAANDIRSKSTCLVVIGIGGSYLGSKASIDLLSKYYSNNDFEVVFLGNDMSSSRLYETLEYLKNKDFCVNVISKSGKTLEPAVAFRFVKELLIEKYGDEYPERVYVTTSRVNSILNDMAKIEGYTRFYIPSDIGGRFSVFTAVGLLPIACAGFDVTQLIKGSIIAYEELNNLPLSENPALIYALIRFLMHKNGMVSEAFVTFEPKAKMIGEWWKQLFGESEGKEHLGLLPISLVYSTDLHSLGQYVQDGKRILFETFLDFRGEKERCVVNKDKKNLDELNYLVKKDMTFIKDKAMEGTIDAHIDGGVPCIKIEVEEISEYTLGYLFYFYMFTCGVSGYLLDVNPFNQEGVEAYKKNMMKLLKD